MFIKRQLKINDGYVIRHVFITGCDLLIGYLINYLSKHLEIWSDRVKNLEKMILSDFKLEAYTTNTKASDLR